LDIMASTVFISHAGGDSPRAAEVARALEIADIRTRLDRAELTLGASFLTFMNQALTTSDYCLLLWSARAAATPWVQMEWEAALYRTVREKRSFLVVGRLEDTNVPPLLEPRLRVDLFPALEPGVSALVSAWRSDRAAEQQTGKPVAAASTGTQPPGDRPHTLYLDSEQFRMTTPISVSLDEPAGAVLDRVVASLGLPQELSHGGMLGVRFSYQLIAGDQVLARAKPLAMQGVKDGQVLTLQTTMAPFSTADPVTGELTAAVFRGEGGGADVKVALRQASKEYQQAVARAGLRPPA
jgi:TIR domain